MFGLLILFPCCTVIKFCKARERITVSNVFLPMRGNLEIYKNIRERKKYLARAEHITLMG